MFVVGVAKAAVEEGVEMLADREILEPSGEVIARAVTSDHELDTALLNCC
jgi:hypothetical protein